MKLPCSPRRRQTTQGGPTLALLVGTSLSLALLSPAPAAPPAVDPGRSPAAGQASVRRSVVLNDGSHWTLIPHAAVIHKPAGLRSLVGGKAVGQLLTWQEFFAKNASWISTTAVTFEEAAGLHALPYERLRAWAKHDKLVIAIHQGAPIPVVLSDDGQSPERGQAGLISTRSAP